jgi:hypothetical protein
VAAWTKARTEENPVFRAIRGPEKEEFLPLPESKKEVETIATDLPKPSTLLLGQDATETRFKSLPLAMSLFFIWLCTITWIPIFQIDLRWSSHRSPEAPTTGFSRFVRFAGSP